MAQDISISVVMSVYNGATYVAKSIDSILAQSFKEFEFIIVNDGSTDNTLEVLQGYADQDDRIVIIDQDNTGLTKALNIGIKEAKGKYIARQDADDIALIDRFEKQFRIMEKNKNIVLCGGTSIDIYPDGHRDIWRYQDEEALKRSVFFKTPFPHSTAFIRANVFDRLEKLYDEDYKTSQDTEFWIRLLKQGRVIMLPSPLIERYILSSSISVQKRWRQFYDALRARMKYAKGLNVFLVMYYSFGGVLINMLPPVIIKTIRSIKGTS